MRNRILASFIVVLLCAAPVKGQSAAELGSAQAVTTGDYAAFLLDQAYRLHANAQVQTAPVIRYNSENMNVIDFHIISADAEPSAARQQVDDTVEWIRRVGIPLVERRMNVRMSDDDFRIYYLVPKRGSAPQALLAWHAGEYLQPAR